MASRKRPYISVAFSSFSTHVVRFLLVGLLPPTLSVVRCPSRSAWLNVFRFSFILSLSYLYWSRLFAPWHRCFSCYVLHFCSWYYYCTWRYFFASLLNCVEGDSCHHCEFELSGTALEVSCVQELDSRSIFEVQLVQELDCRNGIEVCDVQELHWHSKS